MTICKLCVNKKNIGHSVCGFSIDSAVLYYDGVRYVLTRNEVITRKVFTEIKVEKHFKFCLNKLN